jgi:acetylornithine deacetylase/succinyl-diaminopimelate desuccinylase-like protein
VPGHTTKALRERICHCVDRERLLETATKLIAVPSPTGQCGAVSDCLADIMRRDGFQVERPPAGHSAAPAVVVRWQAKKPGRTLQFDGHLDTVHLPFVPPATEDDRLTGSGSSDMKAGVAAAVEALRALRETDALSSGSILLTAHDLHEAPWGDGRQLDQLIRDGCTGNAVLIPEYLNDRLPIVGRGALTWKASIQRAGAPVHEVMRPKGEPSVIAAGARLVQRLVELEQKLSARADPLAGPESVFIGQIHSGEIYNQFPRECFLEGTRRWLPGTRHLDVENELRELMGSVARETGITIDVELRLIRDAFALDQSTPLVPAFQRAHEDLSGRMLPVGAKPFCDDANSFWSVGRIPAITHGPTGGGAHTLHEWVSIHDLVRTARVYALTAVYFCADGL